ncbi:Nudix domain-containing protein [Aspergillus sp. HF37]|nr:Nudix domain-containing protein [Aspergillus sp. HF37]
MAGPLQLHKDHLSADELNLQDPYVTSSLPLSAIHNVIRRNLSAGDSRVCGWWDDGCRGGYSFKGTWALPGGHLEHGESFDSCARREVAEETGLDVADVRFLTATNSVMSEGKHYVTIFMGGMAAGDEVARVMEPEKCAGWELVSWESVRGDAEDEGDGRRLFQPMLDLMRQRAGFEPYAAYLGRHI